MTGIEPQFLSGSGVGILNPLFYANFNESSTLAKKSAGDSSITTTASRGTSNPASYLETRGAKGLICNKATASTVADSTGDYNVGTNDFSIAARLQILSFSKQLTYTGVSFSVGSQESAPDCTTWDGSHFWVSGSTNTVFKYTAAGAYTGTSFSVASEMSTPRGMTWDGTYFWLVQISSGTVFKYTAAGAYTGTSFNTVNDPRGMVWDGSHLWILGNTANTIFKYTTAGAYTGVSFSVAGETTSPRGIAWDGSHFWIVALNANLFKYTGEGVYTGITLSISSEDTSTLGLAWDGSSLWVSGNTNKKLYQYEFEQNIAIAQNNDEFSIGYNNINFQINNGSSGINTSITPVMDSAIDLVITWDGSDWNFYSSEGDDIAFSSSGANLGDFGFTFGAAMSGDNTANVILKDVSFFDRVLTSQEITDFKNNVSPDTFTDCISCWKFNNSLLDTGSAENTVTLNDYVLAQNTDLITQKTETTDVARITYGYYDETGSNVYAEGGGILSELAITNYLTNTYFSVDTNDDGQADGVAKDASSTINGTETYELIEAIADVNITDSQYQRVQYTGVGGDSSETLRILVADRTTNGTFAQDDDFNFNILIKGTLSGCKARMIVGENASGSTLLDNVSAEKTINSNLSKIDYTNTATQATTNSLYCYLEIYEIDNTDTCDIQFICSQAEKAVTPSTWIPTTTTALTRNLEIISFDSVDNRSAAVESCIIKINLPYADTEVPAFPTIMATNTKTRRMFVFGNDVTLDPNADDSALSSATGIINESWTRNLPISLGYNIQHSSPYAAGYYNGVADGFDELNDDFTDNSWGLSKIGSNKNSAGQLHGVIHSVAYYGQILTNTQHLEGFNTSKGIQVSA